VVVVVLLVDVVVEASVVDTEAAALDGVQATVADNAAARSHRPQVLRKETEWTTSRRTTPQPSLVDRWSDSGAAFIAHRPCSHVGAL
jgi:hypothetical protein